MMFKKMVIKSVILVSIIYLGLKPNFVLATPSLGVASDTDIYAYTGSVAPTDDYLNYFADTFIPAIDDYEGFVIGPSGSYLTVFTDYNPSEKDIYLISSISDDNNPITFGGSSLISLGDIGKARSYDNFPYYGVKLPKDITKWTTHSFEHTFFLYTAQITYTGTLSIGDYFFAGADTNGTTDLQYGVGGRKDDSSPKTTSAGGQTGQPVPEPATMTLLGLGLVGLLGFRKRS